MADALRPPARARGRRVAPTAAERRRDTAQANLDRAGDPPHTANPPTPGQHTSSSRGTRSVPARALPWPLGPRQSRGRHISGRGEGFARLLAWTVAGTAVPGSSLVAGGRRRAGWTLIGLFLLLVVAVGLAATRLDLVGLGVRLAASPTQVLLLIGLVALVALVWTVALVAGHVTVRHGRLSVFQQVLSTSLVVAMAAVVLVPAGLTVQYGLISRSTVSALFDEEERPDDIALPDVYAEDPWADEPRVNVLLIGSDAGIDRIGVRPDTLILASVDTASGDTVLFSLPRNLEKARFPLGSPGAKAFPDGFDEEPGFINGVWTWAEANPDLFPGDPNPGLTATRQVVTGTLGVPVDYYAVVDLKGFEEAVDALGGVTVDVAERLPIGGGVNELTGRDYPIDGYIEAGPNQLLNGFEALWFARSRATTSDYDRMLRQRCVIGALVERIQPTQIVRSFPALAASARDHAQTDIRQDELGAWAELLLRVKDAQVRSLPLTNDVITPADPDFAAIRQLVAGALQPPPEPTPTQTPSSTVGAVPPSQEPTTDGEPDPETDTDADEGDEPAADEAQSVSEVC